MLRHPYKNYYTWETPLSTKVMGHTNGAVSCLIEWAGFDCELVGQSSVMQNFRQIYETLKELNCVAEFHWWREKDDTPAMAYLDRKDDIKRGRELGSAVREMMAEHLRGNARSNGVGLVLYRLPKKGIKDAFFKTASRNTQLRLAKQLIDKAERISRLLPNGRIAGIDNYINRVMQSYWRKGFNNNLKYNVDFRYDLSEQLLVSTPKVIEETGIVEIQGHKTKVILLYLYPDAEAGWFRPLSDATCDMHVVQVVSPIDTESFIDKQTVETHDDNSSMADKGAKYALKKIKEREDFTSFVANNGLDVYKNCYIIHLHGEEEDVLRLSEKIEKWVSTNGGQARMDAELQAHFFRAGQLGHGACSGFFRDDDTWQVGNMAPIMSHNSGMIGGESLRLSTTGQLVGLSLLDHKVSHGFTVAQTGAGKGVDKGVEILETYPLGLDWYIIEAGLSYQWIVEAFEGPYIIYDPEKHVLNPFPDFGLVATGTDKPLDVTMCSATVNSLAFLLNDGAVDLSVHQSAAAQIALQYLYREKIEGKIAPRLDHYLQAMKVCSYENVEQKNAAETMMANIESFLSTSVGERFKHDNNITIKPGICGIDLKKVTRIDKKLMEYCLTAIALRFGQMAFYKSEIPSRVLMDEVHEFVKVSPEIIGNTCRQLSRMGRKDGASLDLVTQGLAEMRALDSEVIGSTTLRSLLYRNKDWREMGEILNLADPVIERWQGYPFPDKLSWRPGMRCVHEKPYDLYLTFPDFLLDITSTDPIDLSLKEKISQETSDIFERQKRLKNARLQN